MPLIPAFVRQRQRGRGAKGQRQADLSGFEASMDYRASPRTGSKATVGNPALKQNKTKKKKKFVL